MSLLHVCRLEPAAGGFPARVAHLVVRGAAELGAAGRAPERAGRASRRTIQDTHHRQITVRSRRRLLSAECIMTSEFALFRYTECRLFMDE